MLEQLSKDSRKRKRIKLINLKFGSTDRCDLDSFISIEMGELYQYEGIAVYVEPMK